MNDQILLNRKIVILLPSLALGGAEKQSILLAKYLQEESHAIVVVYSLDERIGPATTLCKRYDILYKTRQKKSLSFLQRLVNRMAFQSDHIYADVIKDLNCEKPDIIVSYMLQANILLSRISRYIKAKAFIWNQRDEGFGFLPGIRMIENAKNITHFISNSNGGSYFLSHAFKISEKNISIIKNGIYLDDPKISRSDWRKLNHIQEEVFCAVMVANLHNRKDHDVLLKSWRIIIESLQADLKSLPILFLVGKLDNRSEDLVTLINQLGIYNQVRITGTIQDVASLYNAMDMCIFASNSEGLPNGILEAMGFGLPVVATKISSIETAVGENNIQYLADPNNANDLAKKVLLFMNNKELLEEVGRNNALYIRAHFSYKAMGEDMNRVLGNVLLND